jgi:predicted ABC-class ATPase
MSDEKYRVATDVIEEQQHLRQQVEKYRQAALIAYGALMARPDGSREVIAVLNKYLFPDDDQSED